MWSHHFMANRWGNNGTVTDFIFLASKITVDNDCSQRLMLLGRKPMTNLGGIELKWCFWTVVLEKTLESPLDCKEIKPVNPKGNESWIFIGRTHAEAPILWLPDAKSWLIRKDPDAGKNWRQEEEGTTEDKVVGWHHWLSDMRLSKLWEMAKDREAWCCSPWGLKELDTTERTEQQQQNRDP